MFLKHDKYNENNNYKIHYEEESDEESKYNNSKIFLENEKS
jgi:hypothetical protein